MKRRPSIRRQLPGRRSARYFASRNAAASPGIRSSALSEAVIRKLFQSSTDVRIHRFVREEGPSAANPLLIYCEGQIDIRQLNASLIGRLGGQGGPAGRQEPLQAAEPSLGSVSRDEGEAGGASLLRRLAGEDAAEQMIGEVFNGSLVLFYDKAGQLLSLPMPNPPQREPSESTTEISVKGPRDGFTEELSVNIALVRKRLRTPSLAIDRFVIGRRSKTRTALLSMTDITSSDLVEEARLRLSRIDVDGLLSSQQLEEALGDDKYALFPLVDAVGRPDFVAEGLLQGRIAILLEGSPMAIIAPTTLTSLVKSPEDLHQPYYFVMFERMLRLVGLLFSMLFPGFWVSVSAFNLDQIPFPLLATVVVSRLGLPLSGPIDLFLMIGLFELFREAGLRLPKAVGQTVAVVGGLIVGDAAISAGLTSPTSLVVSALTAVATFTLVNQSLSGAVTIIRFGILGLSCLFGMFGFFVGLFLLVVYLARMSSFGVSFLAPISPPRVRTLLSGLLGLPWGLRRVRPYVRTYGQGAPDPDRRGKQG